MSYNITTKIGEIFQQQSTFSVKEVKYIWMVIFGYKIRKLDVEQKLGTSEIKKEDLIREIKSVMPFVDKGKFWT